MKTSKKKNNTKKSDNLNTIVICIMTFIAIITLVVCVCIMCSRGNNKKIPGNGTTTLNINDYINEGEYLQINAKDCTIYNGDVIQLTCSSNPVEYASGVNWYSSDTSVVTVTFDGTVTAMGEGVAAVTATHGVLSSSIIIKVINEEETTDAEFPYYEPVVPTTPEATKPANPTTKPNEGATTKPVVKPSEEVTTKPVVKPSEEATTKPIVKPTEPTTTKPTEPPTTQPATKPSEETTTTQKETESLSVKDLVMNSLPEYGFGVYTEDSFVFKEDGNYLGQVIVGHGFTQIYVMTRTTNFDKQLKDFLSVVLPTGYTKAFNNMMNATNDMTFNTDGYKVRVVASPNGGHTQLIIYY